MACALSRLQKVPCLITNQRPYQLSYASLTTRGTANLERETGIEPATNSLEGCDSTIELLPLAVSSAMIAVPATTFRFSSATSRLASGRRSATN